MRNESLISASGDAADTDLAVRSGKTVEDASVNGSVEGEGDPGSARLGVARTRRNNGLASERTSERAFLRAETAGRLLAAMCSACVKFHCSADATVQHP